MITLATKMTIGYKFEVAVSNGFKIMAANGRQIVVTVKNDLFEIYAFTLKGVKMSKEVKSSEIFAEQLNEEIIKAALV